MAHRIHDPELGELINIDELSTLTGIPKSTIRLWRRPEYVHLTKFISYKSPGTSSIWYRLSDVEKWRELNGFVDLNKTRFIPTADPTELPNAVVSEQLEPMSTTHHAALTATKKITRKTWADEATRVDKNWNLPTSFIKEFISAIKISLAYYIEHFAPDLDIEAEPGEDYSKLHWTPYMFYKMSPEQQAHHFERYHFVNVQSLRLINALNENLDITPDEILALPTE